MPRIMLNACRGAELAVAMVFIIAAAAKLADLDSARVEMNRVLFGERRLPRVLMSAPVWVVVVFEGVLGSLLIFGPNLAVAEGATFATGCFIIAATSARRRGLVCGCFGSRFNRLRSPAQLRRSATLFVLASAGAVGRLTTQHKTSTAPAVGACIVCLAVVFAMSPGRSGRSSPFSRLPLRRTPDSDGWRRVTPSTRVAVLRVVRTDALAAEVASNPDVGQPRWWSARVRARRVGDTPIMAIVARSPGGAVQAFWSPNASVAVIGYTRNGIVLPQTTTNR